jgi:hypothetical protein
MKMKVRILFFITLLISSCTTPPVKNFRTTQWLPEDENCHSRRLINGAIVERCFYEHGTEEERDWITIRKSSFNAELDYTDLLIFKCDKWKDGGKPEKEFKTIQWLPDEGNCHIRRLSNDSIETKCFYSNGEEDERDWITVSKVLFNEELNYQDLLISRCKKWKK